MLLGDTITSENIHIFTDPDGLVWICQSCGEIVSPNQAEREWQWNKKYSRAYHYCENGQKHELKKRLVDEILARYKYTYYNYAEAHETEAQLAR